MEPDRPSMPPPTGFTPVRQLAAIFALGALLLWLSELHPSLMPAWAPWDFSWPEYLAITLTMFWFFRGFANAPEEAKLSAPRRAAFYAGLAVIYAATQTRFEYMAQHMFFLNRIQHVAMHHLGPFLVALGNAGPTIRRGMPRRARQMAESRFAAAIMNVLQQPALAAFLFSGLFIFWLIPPVHFHAMIDARLYAVMNWSMVLDGILFWSLVLDPRPCPPARISFATRLVLDIVVIFPQIILGAAIAFSRRSLYSFYDLCGRLYPSISALNDQHLGGVVIWIPPAMMSVIGILLILNMLRISEEKAEEAKNESSAPATSASGWTGR